MDRKLHRFLQFQLSAPRIQGNDLPPGLLLSPPYLGLDTHQSYLLQTTLLCAGKKSNYDSKTEPPLGQ